MTITAIKPSEFDAQLCALQDRQAGIESALDRHAALMHRAAGDQQTSERYGYGRGTRRVWGMTFAQVVTRLTGGDAGNLIAQHRDLAAEYFQVGAEIAGMDDIYRAAPWPRYFPCYPRGGSRDGHIHSTAHGCSTVFPTSDMRWRTDLSGLTTAEAVADLGPALCSVCYPSAPVEQRSKTLGQVERERTAGQRAAEQAARALAKAAKQLADDETFRTRYNKDRVTTVFGLKELIYKAVEAAVELEWINQPARETDMQADADMLARMRQSRADNLVSKEADAEQAAAILIAREAAHPGWGADAAAIAKMRASKLKSARKGWGF